MCLSADALALFLNLIPMERIDTMPDRVVIHADAHEVHWVATEDKWCTLAPQIDRAARFAD